jgi:hypothetical protein
LHFLSIFALLNLRAFASIVAGHFVFSPLPSYFSPNPTKSVLYPPLRRQPDRPPTRFPLVRILVARACPAPTPLSCVFGKFYKKKRKSKRKEKKERKRKRKEAETSLDLAQFESCSDSVLEIPAVQTSVLKRA